LERWGNGTRRNTICVVGPGFPALSTTRAVRTVSPSGIFVFSVPIIQNCCDPDGRDVKVLSFPSGPRVHGALGTNEEKRHAKSTRPSMIAGVGSKLAGLKPGTPPPPSWAG